MLPLMRVNAIWLPSGDQTGQASAVGRILAMLAEAGAAKSASKPIKTSFFTGSAYDAAVRGP